MAHSAEYLANLYEGLGSLQNDFRNFNLLRLVAGCVRGERVLDIGCGSGGLLSLLQQQGHSASGVEPNADLVSLANTLHPELRIVQGTGADLDRVTGLFDTITIIDVLEHIEDDREQLRRIWDRLVPGGQLVVLVPAFPLLYGERDRNNGHFRRYTSRELISKRARSASSRVGSATGMLLASCRTSFPGGCCIANSTRSYGPIGPRTGSKK